MAATTFQAWSQATQAITTGRSAADGALAPTLWATTTFEPANLAQAKEFANQARPTHFYSRYGNPTVAAF